MNLFKNIEILKKENNLMLLLFLFSALIRIPIVLIFGDTQFDNEWGILLYNLINYQTLSQQAFGDFLLPNLWLPPLYAYFIYILSFTGLENQNLVLLILFVQVFLSAVTVVFFYKVSKFFLSGTLSFYSAVVFSIFPIYVFASSQISSVSLAIFLIIFFYFFLFKLVKQSNFFNILLFSIITGLLILTRREFIVIAIITNVYLFLFFKKPVKDIFVILLITTLTISPYLIRNYITFDKIIIHSGFGYNLWQGNNPNYNEKGYQFIKQNLKSIIDKIPKDKFYRINEDKIFIEEAIKNIKENPLQYFILYFKKFFSYLFFDLNSALPNYYNPAHILPIILVSTISTLGIFLSSKKYYSLNYLILIYFFYISVIPIFAIQPRYKIYIIPIQIILSFIFVKFMKEKYFSKK
jgi:hypothetical protein